MTQNSRNPQGVAERCPFLEAVEGNWRYQVPGYCQGGPQGVLMIPTLNEFRTLCSTPQHAACPIFRSRRGEDSLEAWLRLRYEWGGLATVASAGGAGTAGQIPLCRWT